MFADSLLLNVLNSDALRSRIVPPDSSCRTTAYKSLNKNRTGQMASCKIGPSLSEGGSSSSRHVASLLHYDMHSFPLLLKKLACAYVTGVLHYLQKLC